MKTSITAFLWTGLLLASVARARAAENPAAPAAGPDKADVAVGEIFRVALPCNPTTGFQWALQSVDRTIAAPAGPADFQRSPEKADMVGVGGTCVLWLRGVKPGKTSAVFVYRRPWEKKKPLKTFKTRITVVAKK